MEQIIAALEHEIYKIQLRVINYALHHKDMNAEDVLKQIEQDAQTVLSLRGYQISKETTADIVKSFNERE